MPVILRVADILHRERGLRRGARGFDDFVLRRRAGDGLRDALEQFAVVGAVEHHAVDEPRRAAHHQRVERGRAHPEDQHDADTHCVSAVVVPLEDGDGDAEVERRGDGDHREKRQRALEELVGQGEAKVLIEDGEDERDRGVMADQLHQRRLLRPFGVAEMQRGDGEHRQRHDGR